MRLLVTTSRMPYATEEIRKLGRAGHIVHAADTFRAAPGNHSRWVAGRHLVASPRHATDEFLEQVGALVHEHEIELILPMFEDAFYLQRYATRLPGNARVFAPPFEILHRLHHKARFVELASELGVPVPRTVVVDDAESLRAALRDIPHYFARPVYSRGGVFLLTNVGPLSGVLAPDDCTPTKEHPWLVQEFVTGTDVCTFSVARHGEVRAHATYVHPKTIDSAGGIVFESIVDAEALHYVERIVEATGYEGHVSFDFLRTERGLVAIECNPRPTAGVAVMPDEILLEALFGFGPTRVAPGGIRRHIWAALLRDMLLHWREIPSDMQELMSGAEDLYSARGDAWPGLWQFISLAHVARYRRQRPSTERTRSDLMASYFYDVSWDGDLSELPPRLASFGTQSHDDGPMIPSNRWEGSSSEAEIELVPQPRG